MTTQFVAVEDLANHLAVSVSTIRAWVRQGHIPNDTYININNVYRFDKQAVSDALLKKTTIRSVVDSTDVNPVREHDDRQLEMDFEYSQDEDI